MFALILCSLRSGGPTLGFVFEDHAFEQGLDDLLFISSVDPGNLEAKLDLSQPQSWNGYAYVRNNPCAFTDPDGRCICLGQRIRNLWNGWGPYSDQQLQEKEDKWRQYLRDEEKKYGTLVRQGTQIINPETITRAEVFQYAAELREASISIELHS